AVIGWRKRHQARKVRFGSLSCLATRIVKEALRLLCLEFSLRAVLSRVADRLRRARDRRRQRQELIDYLASDHRDARDLGITTAINCVPACTYWPSRSERGPDSAVHRRGDLRVREIQSRLLLDRAGVIELPNCFRAFG